MSNCKIMYNISLRNESVYLLGSTENNHWQMNGSSLSTESIYFVSVIAIDGGKREAESNLSKAFSISESITEITLLKLVFFILPFSHIQVHLI